MVALGCTLLAFAGYAGAATDDVDRLELHVLERINEIRRQHNLETLVMEPALREVARQYSATMGRREFFSHNGPDGDTVGDRVRAAGFCYRVVAENLAKNYNVPDPAATAVAGWMDSPGHRRNILTTEFRQTGIGVWRDGQTYYFTQVFLREFPPEVDCSKVRFRGQSAPEPKRAG